MKPLLAFLASLLVSGGLFAQSAAIDIPYQKFRLENGLTVIVHEDHKAPIVAVNIWYHVGSKNEKPGKTGFAHLFEHLMFNGSEHYNSDYFQVLEKIGATDLNGTTNEDRTNYFQNVPTTALDTVLWMESDRMGFMVGAIDQARLDEQRGVVQNEKRQGENQPYALAYNLIQENTYPAGHPYQHTVIGSMEDLDAASLDDVKEWFQTYYGPSNAVIVLAGDIDLETAREKVEKYFGSIPPGPPLPRFDAWIAKMQGTRRQEMEDRVPQARIYKVWNIPQAFTLDADMLDIASDVLASGKTSRLYKRLVHDDQIATDVSAYVSLAEIGSQFAITATAKPGDDLTAVEKAIDEELAKFLSNGPSADELARVKTMQLASFLRRAERIGGFGGKSDILVRSQVFTGNPEAYKQSQTNVQNANAEQVRDVASRWLSDGEYVLKVHPFPDYKPAQTSVDRSKVPEAGAPPPLRLPSVSERTLSNGLKVIVAERHELPLLNFRLMLNAGFAADYSTEPGTARLAMSVLDEGTTTRNSEQIADELDHLGANLGSSASLDECTVSLSALKANLDGSLAIFADVVLHPSFPEDEFERQKKLQVAGIQREKRQPVTMAYRVLPALLYGKDSAYGNPLTGSGTEESVSKIERDALVKFHDDWFKPNNATLIVVGDTTLDEIAPKLEALFSGWSRGQTPQKSVATAPPAKPGVYLMDRPGASQSIIIAAELAPPKSDAGDIAFEAFDWAFGGAFISRLNMNLREDKHWSYGARSILYPAVGPRIYFAYAPVQTDKTKESILEMDKELHQAVGDKPLAAEEIAAAKDGLTLTLPGERETMNSVAGAIAEVVRYGLPQDYWDTYASKIRALTPKQISTAAERYLKPQNLVWVVVGDRSKIESGIRELDIGEVQLMDPDGNLIQ